MSEESNKKPKRVGVLWWVSMMVCVSMIFGSATCFFLYYKEAIEVAEIYDQIAYLHDSFVETEYTECTEYTDPVIEIIVGDTWQEKDYLDECRELHEMNNDLVGWISFPETIINYPVMQTDIDNRDYYLDHDFNKNYNRYGCIYASEDCDVFKPTDNITLYGHHMNNGSMFAGLVKYESKDYWKEHQYFSFDTLYEHHTYQVVSVFKISADSEFRYHMFTDAADEEEFNDFVNNIRKRQFFDTGISIEYGDKLVCLSTCEYSLFDGRFVVVGKRIT